jgi:hypothetical protein
MDPILDETSLVPCPARAPSARIHDFGRALQALDRVGATRVLRSVRDAADRDLGDGRGLRSWCFDQATSKDAGRLVASRLAAQPFLDGENGLFAAAEGHRAVEARVGSMIVAGLGLAALTDGLVVALASHARPRGESFAVEVTYIEEEGDRTEGIEVRTFALAEDVDGARAELIQRVDRMMGDGAAIVARAAEVFSTLILGDSARSQIQGLTGSEPVFRQLVRHLRALHEGALRWEEGEAFAPVAVTFSVESKTTLDDGVLGALRDFPTPAGFSVERWSLHTTLTGGNGARLYFRAIRQQGKGFVLVGYFGDHLPTSRYRT